jgi:uncharacterized protein (TIGR03437 family)
MSSRHFLRAAALAVAVLLGGTFTLAPAKPASKAVGKPDKPDKPDKGDKGDKGGNDNKPAKVNWIPKRVEMDDVAGDQTITVKLSADKDVLDVSFFLSGSLREFIGLPEDDPDNPIDILDGESVEIVFELLQDPEEAGHTIGGTIQAMSGGKHLAQPLTFSLKRSSSSGTSEETDSEEELMDSDGKLPLSWFTEDEEPLEDITLDLFDENAEEKGLATIIMVPNRDLENLGLWFTPSVSPCISASFDTDADSVKEAADNESLVLDGDNIAFVAAGTEVPVLLTLKEPTEWTCGGGTLHARSVAGNSRSFPDILGVRFAKGEGLPDDSDSSEIVAPAAVVDAASFNEEPVAASQIVSIFGLGLGSEDQAVFKLDDEGKVSSYLNGTMVLFDGYPAPLLSTSAGQINAIVPSAVKGGDVELQVLHNDKQSVLFPIPLGRPTPSLFTLSGTQAAAINSDGTINGRTNRAGVDTIVLLFGTGGGPTRTPLPDGSVATQALWLAGDVRVLVGGIEADVLYAGVAPGLVSAVVQYNIRLNPLTPKGSQPVKVVINGVESNGAATIFVK